MAEALLNPWGDDDDDFQISYLIDRNFQVMPKGHGVMDKALACHAGGWGSDPTQVQEFFLFQKNSKMCSHPLGFPAM